MELFLDLLSPPCRAVYLFAKAAGIPFETKLVQLLKGEQYSEEFSRITPIKKVPVLKDGNFILTESTAIIRYLQKKHSSSVPDCWRPAGLQEQARVDEYLSWQHHNLRGDCQRVFLLRAVFPVVMGSEVPPERMDQALSNMKGSLDLFEEKFLQDKPFIVGDKISIADVVAVVELMQPTATGVDPFAGRPKLLAWRERVKQAVGPQLFAESHDCLSKPPDLKEEIKSNPKLQALLPQFTRIFRW